MIDVLSPDVVPFSSTERPETEEDGYREEPIMFTELLKQASPEAIQLYWMRRREFEEALRQVVLTHEDELKGEAALAWRDRWAAFVDGVVVMRTIVTLAEWEKGLSMLKNERPGDPNQSAWDTQLSKIRNAATLAKNAVGYYEDSRDGGLGMTRKRSVRQNDSVLARLLRRGEAGILLLADAIEQHRRETIEEGIEPGDHDRELWSILDTIITEEGEKPRTVGEIATDIREGKRRR